MKTKQKTIGLLLTASLFQIFLFSCRKLVTDEFAEYKVQPVIYGLFKDAETVRLHISLSDKLQNTPLKYVEDALIILSTNNTVTDTFQYNGEGFYLSQQKVFYGNSYDLKIQIPNFSIIEHTIDIPIPKKINHITLIEPAGVDEEGRTYSGVVVNFSNNLIASEYHQIIIHSLENGQLMPLRIFNINDPVLQSEGLEEALFSTTNLNDTSYSMQLNFQRRSSYSGQATQYHPIVIEFRTVCKDYYQHQKQLILYSFGIEPDPLGQPLIPVQLHSNINGAPGVISSYSRCYSDTLL